jgi:CheY-like chemotaxis protein
MAKSLLLADDSVTIHRMVELCLPPDKFTVIAAKSAEEALARARDLRPDVILADTFMPGKNGYDLAAAVRDDQNLAHIPVVLLTSPNEAFDEARAKSVGAISWLPKPFQSQALSDQLKNALAPRPAPVPPPPVPAPAVIVPPAPAIAAPIAAPAAPAFEPAMVIPAMPPPPPADISMPPPPRAEVHAQREETIPPLSVFPSLAPLPESVEPKPEAPPEPVAVATAPIAPAPVAPAPASPARVQPRPAAAAGRPVMPPRPAGIPVPQPRATLTAQNHEALLREALTKASREMIEKVAWEVVPELAETMIREQLDRLIQKKQG